MENLQTKSEKQYYIPMEVNETSKEFIIANGYNLSTDAVCTKIGHRTVRAIMIPATKEQYLECQHLYNFKESIAFLGRRDTCTNSGAGVKG